MKNLDLPPALVSRFDLIFILIDKENTEYDKEISKFIGNIHKSNNHTEQNI